MKFANVADFPTLFYDSSGNIRRDLLEEIFRYCAILNNLSYGNFIKQLCKWIGKKDLISASKRIEWLLDAVPTAEFRKKWYKKAEQKGPKNIKNFFNSLYMYVVEKYPILGIDNPDLEDIIWPHAVHAIEGKSWFLKLERFPDLLEISRTKNISTEFLAMYIWAFMEAHAWYDLGSSENEDWPTFHLSLIDLLTKLDKVDLLSLCLPLPILETKQSKEMPPKNLVSHKKDSEIPQKKLLDPGSNPSTVPLFDDNDFDGSDENSLYQLLDKYKSALLEVLELKVEIQNLMAESRYDEMGEKLPVMKDYEQRLLNIYSEFESCFSSLGLTNGIPERPKDLFNSETVARDYLNSLYKAVKIALKDIRISLQTSKHKLITELQRAGIAVPDALGRAKSVEEIAQIKESLKEAIEISAAFQRVHIDGFGGVLIEAMSQNNRIAFFKKLAESSSDLDIIKQALEYMIAQNNSFSENLRETEFDIAVELAEKLLAGNNQLIDSFWLLLEDLAPDNFFKKLQVRGFFEVLRSAQNIDIDSLTKVAVNREDDLPDWLVNKIKIYRLENLVPEKRLNLLAEYIRKAPHEMEATLLMVRTLCDLERYKEALYLALICSRMGWPMLADEVMEKPFLKVLLDISDEIDKEGPLFYEMLEDLTWWELTNERTIILLYLLYKSHIDDIYFNLVYQAPEAIEVAREAYPLLTKELMTLNENNLDNQTPKSIPAENEIIEKARSALLEFEEALKKPSCYKNWAPALKYQNYFRRRMKKIFDDLMHSKSFTDFSPDDIINEAMVEENLPEAEGDAARNMKRFLEEQLERLLIIKSSLDLIPLKKLKKYQEKPKEGIEALKDEASQFNDNHLISYLYTKFMERSAS